MAGYVDCFSIYSMVVLILLFLCFNDYWKSLLWLLGPAEVGADSFSLLVLVYWKASSWNLYRLLVLHRAPQG
jgi:hypothetical protein